MEHVLICIKCKNNFTRQDDRSLKLKTQGGQREIRTQGSVCARMRHFSTRPIPALFLQRHLPSPEDGSCSIFYSWSLPMLRLSLLMAGVMAASTSTAGGVSQCPVDTVPIQMTDETSSDPVTTLSAADMSDPSRSHFHAFVTTVTKHVAARLAKDKLCLDSAESKKRSLLQFVKWPLATSGNESLAPVPSLDARPSGGCRIASPWIDLAFERRPVPWIRSVVRWNQRQLLADQAVLAGARNVPAGVAMPLKSREFNHFADVEYADTELLRKPAVKPIEARVPPDLLWLFRRSWQSTFAPFSGGAKGAMNNAMKKNAEGYTQLVIALIDRCFASDGAEIHYNSILDAADLISLEQYKINTPIR